MNPYIHAILYTVLFWAQSTIKNPKSVVAELSILEELYGLLGQLIASAKAYQAAQQPPTP